MHIQSGRFTRVHVIRLNHGDDVLQSLRAAAAKLNLRHGIILSAIGSVTSYHFHVVSSPDMPPAELYPKAEGAYDIAAMQGYIFNGRVHCHIIFSDDKIAFGGHLEEGCRVLTFNVVTIGEVEEMDLTDLDSLKTLNN